MIELSHCDLCAGRTFETLFEASDRMHRVSGRYRVQRCRACRLMFINPQPSAEQLQKHYPADAYYSLRDRPTKTERVVELLNAGPLPLRVALLPLRPVVRSIPARAGARILDVGCGKGHFLRTALRLGMECHGVEPGLASQPAFAEQPGVELFAGTLEQAAYPDDYFDVITINHVLEHVHSPASTLRELRRVLKPGGTVVIATPQSRNLPFALLREDWVQLDVPRHLFTFSTELLVRYCEQIQLRVTKVRYNAGPFQFLGSLLYWSNRYRAQPKYLDDAGWHHSLFAFAAALPFAYLGNLLRIGDQVEVYATK
jgi:2-polyprenyl-3-methyl-5-hydroxy-6-metoxy-1,4-benzoquinol methylase